MIGSLIRFLSIVFREKPVELKPGVRYRATLNLAKVRPGKSSADVGDWLLKMGFTPTSRPEVWKTDESHLRRIPADSIVKAEKL